jgi:hypothetical protein
MKIAVSCLALLLAAPGLFGSSLSTPLPVDNYHLLLSAAYPIETSVSFHASLMHWMDSLAGLNGAGLTGGKTQRAHRIEYNHVLGRPTDHDREVLLGFAEARVAYASENVDGDVDGLTRAFLAADTIEEAFETASSLLTESHAQAMIEAMNYFAPRYREIWQDGVIARGFLHRASRDKKRRALSKFLIRVAEFYGVSPSQKPHPQVVLMPVIDGAGTHAQAIGHHLLIEIRHWEGLIDETAPIVHENAHLLFHRMSDESIERLTAVADETRDGPAAWHTLKEALPTAIAQGLAYQRFLPERWSMDRPWYHREEIDVYAKRIFPLVKQTFESGGSFDEEFLRRALAEFPPLSDDSTTPAR